MSLLSFITATTVISKSIRVYLQVFMGFGFPAFMPGQWVWETPLCSGVDLSHESQTQLYQILLLESKLPFWRFLPHFLMYSDANNSAGIRSTSIPNFGIDISDRCPANQPSKRQNTPFSSHNYYDPTGFTQPPVHSPRLMMT